MLYHFISTKVYHVRIVLIRAPVAGRGPAPFLILFRKSPVFRDKLLLDKLPP